MSDWEIETTESGNDNPFGLTVRNKVGQQFSMEEPEAIYLGHEDFYYDDGGSFIKIDYQIIAFVDLNDPQEEEYEWDDFMGFVSVNNHATPNTIITIIDVNSGMKLYSNKSKGSISSTLIPLQPPVNGPIS